MRSETIGQLAAALARAQAKMEGAVKDSTNPHFRSKYADLASVREACISHLTAQEIAVVQSPATEGNRVSVETLLIHSSGEYAGGVLSAEARDASPQAVGSAITYLRRYSLASLAGIAPEDDDGNAAQPAPGTGYTVTAPRSADITNPRVTATGPSVPNGGEIGTPLTPKEINEAVQAGYDKPQPLTILSVEKRKTSNANVSKYIVSLSDGRAPTTIKEPLAKVAEARCQDGAAVTVETKTTKYGEDLVNISTVPSEDRFLPSQDPLTADDIPF